MAAWHRSRHADLGLRAVGLLLCGLAYAAIARLAVLQVHPQAAGALAYGLGAVAGVAGSGGSAMLTLGRRLFDDVTVSPRWHGPPDAARRGGRT